MSTQGLNWGGLVLDVALRQRLLQFIHARLRYFGAKQVKHFKLPELGQLLEEEVIPIPASFS